MRAWQIGRAGPNGRPSFELAEVDDPVPATGELRLRVVACAVCRTDLQLARGEIDPRRVPVTPGHQVVGVVDAVGEGAEGWSVGDRAGVVWLAGSDGTCRFCRSGRENLCEASTFTGWDRDGGFARLVTARADHALRLPDGFGDVDAAPLLCGGVIGFRALRLSGIQPGGRLGLYGFGASALQAIQVARAWDCEVYVATRSPDDRSRAESMGARWVGGYDELPPVPLDAAVTFAPVGAVVVAALRALDRGATVAINAIHLDRVPEFPYDLLWWERSVRSVANVTMDDARDYLALAAAIPVRTVVETLPLDAADEALRRIEQGAVEGAIVLVPSGGWPDPSPEMGQTRDGPGGDAP